MKERVMRWGLCLFLLFSKEGKSTFFNDLLDLSDQPYRSLLMNELCSVLKRAENLDPFSKEESILDDLTPELLEKAFMDAYSLNPDQNSWTLFTYPQNWLGKPFSKLVSKIGWGGQIYCPAPGYLIPRTEFHIESLALRQEVLSCLEPLINAGVNPFSVVSKQDYEKERCLGSQSPWYGVTQHFGVHLRKEGGQPPLFITSSLVQCIFLLLETDKEYFVAHLDIFTTLKQLQSDLKSFWGNRKGTFKDEEQHRD
jgi:hypothetical protein